ncbi:MAG TPA: type VI immunity family protein, partial [Archangium sp.]|nr:type VI immunity family protein [Archangium sp.]
MPTAANAAKNLEHFETIDGESVRLVSLSMGLTLFLPIPFRDVAGTVKELFEQYLQLVPRTVFRWQNLGGTSSNYKPISSRAFSTIDGWLSLRRSYGSSCAIWLQDGPTDIGTGDYLFRLFGQDHATRPNDSGFLQILFPWNLPETMGQEPLVTRIHQLLQHLPFHSGYLGYTLETSTLNTIRPYSSIIATKSYAAAQRYPGLEITKPHLENYEMKAVLRPPSWITFLSHPFLEKLGGEKEFRGVLQGDFVLRPLEHGWSIQA